MRASAVIGANYGDEGKGLLVDWLAAQDPADTVVVRYNGGAQAGHTVVTPAGIRHVFHHFGSGTLAGSKTFLSRHFLVNPIQYAPEYHELRAKLATPPTVRWPVVFVDQLAPVTTPWDMMLNQAAERRRGNGRHGSCGMGINETAQRHTHLRWQLTANDLVKGPDTRLRRIRDEYVPQRAGELGVELEAVWKSEELLRRYLQDVKVFLETVTVTGLPEWRAFKHVVFEGAQGLRLDELATGFPYLTRSRTGLTNILDLLTPHDTVEVYYATRPYITRHGEGPLAHGCPKPLGVVDWTNLPNEWQGTLRFGEFDVDEFVGFVANDLEQDELGRVRRWHLAVTCLDQVGEIPYYQGDVRDVALAADFMRLVSNAIGAHRVVGSYGMTRTDVVSSGELSAAGQHVA